MDRLNDQVLGNAIVDIYTNPSNYRYDKHVPSFDVNGTFIGDFFSYVMLELRLNMSPVFYHIYSPYDVVSNASPQFAAVIDAGKTTFDGEVTHHIQQRTGIMTPIVLRALDVQKISSKQILFIGTGKIATSALTSLKAYYPELEMVSYLQHDAVPINFTAEAKRLDIKLNQSSLREINAFDIIICHTNAKQPILTADMVSQIKPGAIISSFVSEDHAELDSSFYNTTQANVIIDWHQTSSEASDLKTAIEEGIANPSDLILMSELLAKPLEHKISPSYTIYRSHGTPMQNLAVLHLLTNRVVND